MPPLKQAGRRYATTDVCGRNYWKRPTRNPACGNFFLTGMGELHFSRCTGQRWTWDIPYIQPAAGETYWVSGPLRTQTVGPALTAQDAIAMVVQRLPAGCGPAFPGTPEELAAHEAATQKQLTDES